MNELDIALEELDGALEFFNLGKNKKSKALSKFEEVHQDKREFCENLLKDLASRINQSYFCRTFKKYIHKNVSDVYEFDKIDEYENDRSMYGRYIRITYGAKDDPAIERLEDARDDLEDRLSDKYDGDYEDWNKNDPSVIKFNDLDKVYHILIEVKYDPFSDRVIDVEYSEY